MLPPSESRAPDRQRVPGVPRPAQGSRLHPGGIDGGLRPNTARGPGWRDDPARGPARGLPGPSAKTARGSRASKGNGRHCPWWTRTGEGRRSSQLTGQDVRARVDRLNVRRCLGGKKGRAQVDLQGEFFAGALGGVRQRREQFDSPACEYYGLLIGEDAERVLSRHQEI